MRMIHCLQVQYKFPSVEILENDCSSCKSHRREANNSESETSEFWRSLTLLIRCHSSPPSSALTPARISTPRSELPGASAVSNSAALQRPPSRATSLPSLLSHRRETDATPLPSIAPAQHARPPARHLPRAAQSSRLAPAGVRRPHVRHRSLRSLPDKDALCANRKAPAQVLWLVLWALSLLIGLVPLDPWEASFSFAARSFAHSHARGQGPARSVRSLARPSCSCGSLAFGGLVEGSLCACTLLAQLGTLWGRSPRAEGAGSHMGPVASTRDAARCMARSVAPRKLAVHCRPGAGTRTLGRPAEEPGGHTPSPPRALTSPPEEVAAFLLAEGPGPDRVCPRWGLTVRLAWALSPQRGPHGPVRCGGASAARMARRSAPRRRRPAGSQAGATLLARCRGTRQRAVKVRPRAWALSPQRGPHGPVRCGGASAARWPAGWRRAGRHRRAQALLGISVGVGARALASSAGTAPWGYRWGMGAQRAAHSQPREHPRSTPRPRAPCEEATTRTHPCSFPTDPKVSVCVLEPKTTHRPALSIRP